MRKGIVYLAALGSLFLSLDERIFSKMLPFEFPIFSSALSSGYDDGSLRDCDEDNRSEEMKYFFPKKKNDMDRLPFPNQRIRDKRLEL